MKYQDHLTKLKYYESHAGKIAYIDEGEGPVILLLHGVPTSSWLYRKITPQLVQGGYRVIAPDMLGYGASDKPAAYEVYADKNMASYLLALMNFLEIPNWTQVFHDGAGLWTWAMLQEDASRVNRLFMLNTIVYQSGFKPPLSFEEGWIARLFTRLYSHPFGQRLVINPTFKNGVKNKSVINPDMLEGYKLPFRRKAHHGLYYFFTQTCKKVQDYTSLHQSLNVPMKVIWGKHDDILVWENISEQVKSNFSLKESDIHILNGKHFIQEEFPDEISRIILSN